MNNVSAADFSLVLGGPLYQLWRRTRLAGDALQMLHRRLVAIVLIAWVPLLLLSLAEGNAWGEHVELPFLHDVEIHVRLLFALPLLVVAELIVHQRMRLIVGQFLERGLIPDAAQAQFDAAIASALRLRNSVTAEAVLLAVVYVVGVGIIWRTQVALDVSSWYAWSLAGGWLGFVSLPLFQFLLLRWYFRLFIWARFLWQVSRVELSLMPMHPDRCGGLGFLSGVAYAFAPLLVAQGAVLAGVIAQRILLAGARLTDFLVEIAGLVFLMLLAILAPMLVFARKLAAAKRAGMREYGALAQRYAREFDRKWLRAGAPPGEPLVGSADIQSLADMSTAYEVAKGMRLAPFNLQAVVQLAVATLLPVAPLALTMFSLDELLLRLLKILF